MTDFGIVGEPTFTIVYTILYILFFIVVFYFFLVKNLTGKNLSKSISNILSAIYIVALSLIVGLRTYNIGVDTETYKISWDYDVKSTNNELVFDFLMSFVKFLGLPFGIFLLIVSLSFHLAIYRALKNITDYFKVDLHYIIFCLFSLFFVLSMSINVIRQGLSLAILLYAYSLSLNKSKRFIIFAILSVFIHTTSIIPISIFIFIKVLPKKIFLGYFVFAYFSAILIAYLNIGILDIAPFLGNILADNPRASYLQVESDVYTVGFKLQFVVFNTILLFLAFFARKYNYFKGNTYLAVEYEVILKYYIVTSILFFMVFQIPYSDRWGLFSWISTPLLILPYFSRINDLSRYKVLIILFFLFIFIFFRTLYT